MSKRETCHGCDGKGWICFTARERQTPFREQGTNTIIHGETLITRECAVDTCPICKGSGNAPARAAAKEGA